MPHKNIKILLIEDDIDDVELLKEAFTNINVNFSMEIIMEGDKVISFLEKKSLFPDIIIMDLNLPKTDGREILKTIKSTPLFNTIPLVVLSTSSAKEDIEYSYKMGASKFITKPVTMAEWNEAGSTIVGQIADHLT